MSKVVTVQFLMIDSAHHVHYCEATRLYIRLVLDQTGALDPRQHIYESLPAGCEVPDLAPT